MFFVHCNNLLLENAEIKFRMMYGQHGNGSFKIYCSGKEKLKRKIHSFSYVIIMAGLTFIIIKGH